jgi:predicted MFS family arabinose efflux permease
MISLSLGMFCLTLGLIQANDKGWSSTYILTLFIVAFLSLTAFYISEKVVKEPMIPTSLFKNPYFCSNNGSLVILGIGLMCGVFFMSFFLITVMEMSQLKAGLIITALPLSAMVFSAISGYFSDHYGCRWFAVAGAVLLCWSLYLMAGLTPHSTLKEIIIKLILTGAATGFAMPPVVTASVHATPDDKIGVASAVGNVSRTLGAILGVALSRSGARRRGRARCPRAPRRCS